MGIYARVPFWTLQVDEGDGRQRIAWVVIAVGNNMDG